MTSREHMQQTETKLHSKKPGLHQWMTDFNQLQEDGKSVESYWLTIRTEQSRERPFLQGKPWVDANHRNHSIVLLSTKPEVSPGQLLRTLVSEHKQKRTLSNFTSHIKENKQEKLLHHYTKAWDKREVPGLSIWYLLTQSSTGTFQARWWSTKRQNSIRNAY